MRPNLLASGLLLVLVAACGGGESPVGTTPPPPPPAAPPPPPPAPSPVAATIAGRVVDAGAVPVVGASIVAIPGNLAATTDAQGRYTISGFTVASGATGTYSVTAARVGYESTQSNATVTYSAPNATLDLAIDRSLRSVAALKGVPIGTILDSRGMSEASPTYQAIVKREFGVLASGWEFFWQQTRPSETIFDFSLADGLVNFAQANGKTVHGHNLLWHNLNPPWLVNGTYNRAASLALLKNHILTVVGRYIGKIPTWDVVNEVVADPGDATANPDGLRKTFWLDRIGPDYIDSAFVWAHQADPAAKLYLNEYGIEAAGTKQDKVVALVNGLVARGIPVNGIGLQSHFVVSDAITGAQVAATVDRFSSLNFDVRISEMDVRMSLPASDPQRTAQADVFQRVLSAVINKPRLKGILFWGFTDKYDWTVDVFPGLGAAMIWDANYQRKPAYQAVLAALLSP